MMMINNNTKQSEDMSLLKKSVSHAKLSEAWNILD